MWIDNTERKYGNPIIPNSYKLSNSIVTIIIRNNLTTHYKKWVMNCKQLSLIDYVLCDDHDGSEIAKRKAIAIAKNAFENMLLGLPSDC